MSVKQTQQECLISGYTRQNYTAFVPFDIVHLMQKLHDEYFYWSIKGDELNKFKQANPGDIIYPKSCIKLNDIVFEMRIFPNGRREPGSIQCVAEIKLLPPHIRN